MSDKPPTVKTPDIPKSTLSVLNAEYQDLTGKRFFLYRSWNMARRQWSYVFRGGAVRVTYVGALLLMRHELEAAIAFQHRAQGGSVH
jgi:hypothetical protein